MKSNALLLRLKPAHLRWLDAQAKARGLKRQQIIKDLLKKEIDRVEANK